MELLSDPHVYGLFRESIYATSEHNYNRESAARVLDAILEANQCSPADVVAVSLADDFVAVCKTGVGVGGEYGMFNKRVQLGDFVPWHVVASIALTEPGFKVFGIDLKDQAGSTLLALKWTGVIEGLPERDRVCDVMMRLIDGGHRG